MSRFKQLSPWSQRINSNGPDEVLEDESRSGIVRQRQEATFGRIETGDTPDLIASTGSTDSSTSAPIVASPAASSYDLSSSITSTPTKTPYNLLKRLANAEQGMYLSPSSRTHFSSYVSHTSESVIEAEQHIHMLEAGMEETKAESTMTFEAISRMMAKEKSAHPEPVHVKDPAAPDVSSQSFSLPCLMTPAVQTHERRIFETPRTERNARGEEVAQGYRSPPQSRHTSPEISLPGVKLFKRDLQSLDRQSHAQISLNSSPLKHPIPRRISEHEVSQTPASPRSRLTRTLIEIQAELASSREGFEEIENRLGVLERHVSLDREQIQKHVLDCVKSMAEEADDSYALPTEIADMGPEAQIEAFESDSVVELIRTDRKDERSGMSFMVRTAFCVCLGALATEWIVMQVMGEMGRRHALFTR